MDSKSMMEMQEIADALNVVIPAYIEAWHQDNEDGRRLRSIVSLPARLESLLLFFHKASSSSSPILPGTMRPDIIIDEKTSQLRVCEINARFSVNGFLLSAHLNEALRISSCLPNSLYSRFLTTSIPHMHSFISDLKRRLLVPPSSASASASASPLLVVWAVFDREPLVNDILLLESSLNNCKWDFDNFGQVRVNVISPDTLSVDSDGLLLHTPTGEIISSCLLELHQSELISLSDSILLALLRLSSQGRCLNDLRAILLAHDKRLLSVLSGCDPFKLLGMVTRRDYLSSYSHF
jgi:hypothetical protein